MLVQRILAAFILIIPGAISMYGIKVMRDAFFQLLRPDPGYFFWLPFTGGLIMFIGGLAFVAGFIYNREKKLGRLQKKLARKQNVKEWLKKQDD